MKGMPSASAFVPTDRPARYIKQLVSHFAGKVESEPTETGAILRFAYGTGRLEAGDGGIRIEADAGSEEDLAHVEDVVARHLVRFGTRDELVVTWTARLSRQPPPGPST